ncbi:MAG: DUF1295 domain-containing protein [Pseudomonadota bacterium]
MKSIRGLIVALVTALIAAAVAWAASFGTVTTSVGPYTGPLFGLFVIIAFGINWLVFIPSAIARTEKFYDLTGSLTYLSLIAAAAFLTMPLDVRGTIVAVCVAVWALRLGTFLFSRIRRDGEDRRFAKIKINPLRFLAAWSIQALWCFLTAAAALGVLASEVRVPIDLFLIVGLAMWVVGFVIETIADGQKKAFRADPANRDRFITTGLWAWSQHPNYFGEILLWCGVAVMALPVLNGGLWIVLISPVFVALLLLRVSGVPLLDAHALAKWGDDPAYKDYRKRTSKIIPLPPRG